MKTDDFIFEHIFNRLASELPDFMVYHDLRHTRFVIDKAIFLAQQEGVSAADLRLVSIAALFHDTGYLRSLENHEANGCIIAKEELPHHGFSTEEIEKICGMIMATKIPQSPTTLLEKIVADADLFYLGTERYTVVSDRLYQELKHIIPHIDDDKWIEIQRSFLTKHHFHTDYARTHLEPGKKLNMDNIA